MYILGGKSLSGFILAILLAGCAGQTRHVVSVMKPKVLDQACLSEAVSGYYTADTIDGLRKSVRDAGKCGPESGVFHEIAGDLAWLEDRDGDALNHWISGVRDVGAMNGRLLLARLADLSWTFPQRQRIAAVLRGVRSHHPDHGVRALAARMSLNDAYLRGDSAEFQRAKAELGTPLKFAFVGPFDNDQGKGFDAAYGPESGIDLQAKYPSKTLPVTWRQSYPEDPSLRVDLGAVIEDENWQVAYGLATVRVSEKANMALRLSTTGPIKIWLNGQLIFSGRRLGEWFFDGVTVPVTMEKGINQILVKSAHDKGRWLIFGRLTQVDGKALKPGLVGKADFSKAHVSSGTAPRALGVNDIIRPFVAALPDGPRKEAHRLMWAINLGLQAPSVAMGEAFVGKYPGSIVGRYRFARSLWDNQERGRTADLLNRLNKSFGGILIRFAMKQARFWSQQKLHRKARTLLAKVAKSFPERKGIQLMLAQSYKREGWHAERCRALQSIEVKSRLWPKLEFMLADCFERLKFYPEAEARYRRVLTALPNSGTALRNIHWLAQGNDRFGEASLVAKRLTKLFPQIARDWERLGETRRRMKDFSGARSAFAQVVKLNPRSPKGYRKLGHLAIQEGKVAEAVKHWRQALAANPNDERIANRIAWLAPASEGVWAVDVPSDDDIEAAIMAGRSLKPEPGSDVAYLLDDEVTLLNGDGSTTNVVTMVAKALNQAGRDHLTKMRIRSGGRHRLRHAFAVGPKGERIEASSIRGRTVRFRKLKPGFTTVLQYRIDESADSYLSGHMSRQWWFQGPGVHTVKARWVLWTQKGVTFKESVIGPVKRNGEDKKGHHRVVWSIENAAPLISEPGMPGMAEVAYHVAMSTVPNWETFWKWEQALLVDAFRESPEVVALANQLMAGLTTPSEKIAKIHTYLMRRIRYQQDYERTIAGVKPHPAPVVVERQYGDCKDKAVLFITLARLAGLKVHFALVRTRNAGPVRRDVPMQQFNHAIVYVPKQPGIEEGRFYDPTVDALDVDVLRHDDQGTWSAVYDPESKTHTWLRIPYQAASFDVTRNELDLSLEKDGSLTGEVELIAKGRVGEFLRKTARNPEKFKQILARQVVSRAIPNARLIQHQPIQLEDVSKPARVRMKVKASSVTRAEGREVRLQLPIAWSPKSWFVLSERRHPLLLGTPRTLEWQVHLTLPKRAKIVRLPSDQVIQSKCISFERTVTQKDGRIIAAQKVQYLCERLSVTEYSENRQLSARIEKALAEEVVLTGAALQVSAR